jgi:hypothetical protein
MVVSPDYAPPMLRSPFVSDNIIMLDFCKTRDRLSTTIHTAVPPPPEALSHPGGFIDSTTTRDLLERRLADLLERYPMVDYVWLWQDEDANWESRKTKVPLSTTPFAQAHAFLRKHAPDKCLVLAGWGGVTQQFESLHQRLPEDIIFSSLNDSLGWDPTNEAVVTASSLPYIQRKMLALL